MNFVFLQKKIKTKSSTALLFAFQSVIFLVQAPFRFDGMHDGLILTMAVASSESLTPNRDFFAPYGPMMPFIHGIVLKIFGNQMLNLRIFNSLLLALIGTILFLILRKSLKFWPAVLIVMVWATSAPKYILNTDLPWSVVIVSFFYISAIYLLIQIKLTKKVNLKFQVFSIAFILLIILSFFARPQGLALLILLTLHLSFSRSDLGIFKVLRKIMLTTLIVSVGLSIVVLILQGMLIPYGQQSFIWPIKSFLVPNGNWTKGEIVGLIITTTYPFFFFVSICLNSFLPRIVKRTSWILILITLCLLVPSISLIDIQHKSLLNWRYEMVFLVRHSTQILGYAAVGLVILTAARHYRAKSISYADTLILLTGFGALLQLIPTSDELHLWWITPPLIASVSAYLSKLEIYTSESDHKKFIPLFVSIIVGSLISIFLYISIEPRYQFQSSLLRGMYASKSYVSDIDRTVEALNSLPKNSNVKFDCVASIFAVFNGTYAAKNETFVNLGLAPLENQRVQDYDYALVCYVDEFDPRRADYEKNTELFRSIELSGGAPNLIFKYHK